MGNLKMNLITPLKVQEINALLAQGFGMRKVACDVGVAKNTVLRYRNFLLADKIIYCACGKPIGHRGFCSVRLSRSPARQEYLANSPHFCLRVPGEVKAKPKPIELDRFLRWPYITYGNNIPDVVVKVHEAVPLTIPEKVRPDLCQDIIVDILDGVIEVKDIPRMCRKYLNSAYRKVSDYRVGSIYDNIRGTDGLKLIDTLSENRLWQLGDAING